MHTGLCRKGLHATVRGFGGSRPLNFGGLGFHKASKSMRKARSPELWNRRQRRITQLTRPWPATCRPKARKLLWGELPATADSVSHQVSNKPTSWAASPHRTGPCAFPRFARGNRRSILMSLGSCNSRRTTRKASTLSLLSLKTRPVGCLERSWPKTDMTT